MYRILVIEDSQPMRHMFSALLKGEGYECVLAGDIATGYSACTKGKPDLVLLDVNLPDGDGIDLCRRLKSEPALRHIPILIITGEEYSIENKVAGLESGADDFVIKPFKNKEFLARLRGILKAASRPSVQ